MPTKKSHLKDIEMGHSEFISESHHINTKKRHGNLNQVQVDASLHFKLSRMVFGEII
jgi:hypothetical protein